MTVKEYEKYLRKLDLTTVDLSRELGIGASTLYGAKSRGKFQKWLEMYLKLRVSK